MIFSSFLVKVFKKYIANFELIHHFLEEKSVFWVDDIDHVCSMMIKTLKLFKEDSDELVNKRIEVARSHSWENSVNQIYEVIQKL